MKILRKGDKFQKRKEATAEDRKAIKELINHDGWSYCDKATWKREVRDKGKKVENDG